MTARRNPVLCALWIVDPQQACRDVADALRQCGGNISATARHLHVCRRTMNRWLAAHGEMMGCTGVARKVPS